ncbi:TPA: hypothetical protein CPT90_05715 [Candidatus Gastranaerophilales bacterium HUM_3]|nr:MAG TPA: hypothetical protein CPT90_05715 [Candidatus Gastranaerophilales bacterium HUM_3]
MLSFEFVETLSPKEIETITSVFSNFGKPIFWNILRVIIKYPDLTQQEIATMVGKKNISEEVGFLEKHRLVEVTEDWLTRTKRVKRYKIIDSELMRAFDKYTVSNVRKFSRKFYEPID